MVTYNKHFGLQKRYLAALIVVLLLIVMTVLELTNTTHLFHKPVVGNSSTTNAGSGDRTPTTDTGINKGTATDNNGMPSTITTSASKWTISTSGLITVKNPIQKDKVASGFNLVGVAGIDQVQYRLVDDQVGVISQGFIKVVNGVFSANVNFAARSTTGQLDVFSSDSYGREINEVRVMVTF